MEMITIPRSVLEALVDPVTMPFVYIADVAWCRFCNALWEPPIRIEHASDCPVRSAQEALAAAKGDLP